MPIYEYRCGECGHQQEFLQKVSDAPLVECPKCHKPGLTKLLSAAGFQLKGSGWYATDFKSKGAAPAKKEGIASDAKFGDAMPGDSKGGDSKGGDSKGGDSKAAATTGGCGTSCACH